MGDKPFELDPFVMCDPNVRRRAEIWIRAEIRRLARERLIGVRIPPSEADFVLSQLFRKEIEKRVKETDS